MILSRSVAQRSGLTQLRFYERPGMMNLGSCLRQPSGLFSGYRRDGVPDQGTSHQPLREFELLERFDERFAAAHPQPKRAGREAGMLHGMRNFAEPGEPPINIRAGRSAPPLAASSGPATREPRKRLCRQ